MLTYETYIKGLGVISGTFQNYKVNLKFMYNYLQDLSDEEFMKAINEIIKGMRELYPNTNLVALIREKARVSQKKLPGEAWAIVLGAVSSVGSYGYPSFSDPVIAKAVECIGWRNICLSENVDVVRAHFIKAYENLVKREDYEQQIGNTQIGFEEKKQIEGQDDLA